MVEEGGAKQSKTQYNRIQNIDFIFFLILTRFTNDNSSFPEAAEEDPSSLAAEADPSLAAIDATKLAEIQELAGKQEETEAACLKAQVGKINK